MAATRIQYSRHMAIPYVCHIVSIWQVYGSTILLPYWHHMAAMWFSHMPAIWHQYGSHIVYPYSSHINTIWKAYGSAICLPYGVLGANHMKPHIVAIWFYIWYPYGWHMTMLLGTDPSSVHKALSYGDKIAKIGPVYQEIFDEISQFFLAMSYLTFANKYCQLRRYWTEFHEIFPWYRGIICAFTTLS